MKTKNVLLSIDVAVQIILLVLLGTAVVASIITMGKAAMFIGLVLFFLGIWQVGSGIVFGIIKSDGARAEYAVKSVFYICFLIVGCYVFEEFNLPEFLALFLIILFFLVIPSGIAIWYFKYSQADLEKSNLELENQIPIPKGMDEILDSDEILRS